MAGSDIGTREHKRRPYGTSPRAGTWRHFFTSLPGIPAIRIAILALIVGWCFHFLSLDTLLGPSPSVHNDTYWESHRDEVRTAFTTSWDAYAKYAWGHDRFHPLSKRGSQMSPNGLGWIIVDSLDTLMIMNLTTRLSDARQWLDKNLTYDQDQDVNTFETTIRMLGGLLSAHYLSTQLPDASSGRDSVYLSKAVDLADRLLAAYDSGSGIPYASVNLAKREGIRSHADGGASSTAEAATVQLEMKYLSHLTGDNVYWDKAERVMEVLDSHAVKDGLVPIFVNPDTGRFRHKTIRLGSRGDSYYVKQYLQTNESIYGEMWEEALTGIQMHLLTSTKHSNLQYIAELPSGIGGRLSPKMDHLVCFLPGSIAIGATEGLTEAEARRTGHWNPQKEEQMRLARELTKTCWAQYAVTETGLAPEIIWFDTEDSDLGPSSNSNAPRPSSRDDMNSWIKDINIRLIDADNLQRPETVESLFLMYRVTKDPIYRQWGWEIFKAFQKHTRVKDGQGYTSLNDVTIVPPKRRDNMESFWLAETLKYLYLLFSPSDFLPLTDVVFNTEAHVFPRLHQAEYKTGWARKRRL
ncbi:mannosyl-oligosaccharide alpha-1,2-mannosidase [Aspergillus tubingensis]|uniref:alpha-1,2-Mannosidase n=1 Tax=Aspergillus tubingensis TaxID=5068 RepID=A0A9W6AWS6_ASPTU|nr:mannosyl-oligosaccharide alpha-1,2-mannosidase [Aspergillus tubingensis]GLA78764.1 mannosyl-oligosaccharide alpha-1,2-mannosidase [Aspergillus tubingensis]GLA89785.1 mannosyl-oligosaccharide alpha-1,2-mannosidase [Aspergillus tubingensis]GLA97883.1 mannosyl-oligosaccharide alpha-1,2-mannosidase [Aspergillus tubingensis]GLB14451.1 mannosyl-oligosaccharide alpha-1,2-mannosidase [Aspergillus tubingensis]